MSENNSHDPLEEFRNKRQPTLLEEFCAFIVHEKKWWLTPIVIVLLAIGILMALANSGVAPFIYPLF